MRLIDADALVTKCGDYYVEEGPEYGFIGTLKTLIDMQHTIGGWISVKDRLPERKEYLHESNVIRGSSEYVLVYISATFPYKRMFVTIGRYSYDEMYPRWIVRSSHDGDVTHWMPLPEPPEEE